MKNRRWFFWGLILLLSACKNESQPKLDLEGHWVVDHGFHDGCQIGASFYEERVLILTVYSLEEGACQPELYGIEGDALMIDIESKRDYFNDEGALTAALQVTVPARTPVGGTLQITETANGLEGLIVSTKNDPEGLLDPLLEPTYTLARVPEDWFSYLRGRWGLGCDAIGADGGCEVLEFQTQMIGKYRQFGRCNERLECGTQELSDFIYALRNVEKIAEDEYRIDMIIFGPRSGDGPPGRPATFVLSPGSLELVGEGMFYPLIDLPVVSAVAIPGDFE